MQVSQLTHCCTLPHTSPPAHRTPVLVTLPTNPIRSIYNHHCQTRHRPTRFAYPIDASPTPSPANQRAHPLNRPLSNLLALVDTPRQPCTHPRTNPHPHTVRPLSSAQSPTNSTRSAYTTTDHSRPHDSRQILVDPPTNPLRSINKHHHQSRH